MPEVAFHTGLPDKVEYACRLLRKAWRQRQRVAVTADAATLGRLDAALWTFEPQGFVPHVRLAAGASPAPRLARTPIWLVDDGARAPQCDVLVNLGPAQAADAGRYARVIELVGASDADRQAGRQRWQAYRSAGWSVTHHARDGDG
ncbi:DNA polymerase III subunit chi [Azohydromonas sediminis]|uniref:DNA polymerase III subunit chi n=1 Tax=Azohydromonas sediminis TaxID=2259674 RepID=UPI000E6511AB|nr:DNA polymerase III subunit chi [Azohydromonas sediminis]